MAPKEMPVVACSSCLCLLVYIAVYVGSAPSLHAHPWPTAIFSPALDGFPDLQKGGSHSSSCCQGLRKYVFSHTEDISAPQSFLYLPLCDRAVLLLTFVDYLRSQNM